MNASLIFAPLAASFVVALAMGCSKNGVAVRRAPDSDGPPSVPPSPPPGPRISGPYAHDNLTVFLIHGPNVIAGDRYLTLQEALEQKKVIVHETGNVNELSIENVSDDLVFIQSGDIVKGGKQDRTIATDIIASAHSGRIPVASFCVEQGRWTARRGEASERFAVSSDMVAGTQLKLAANSNSGVASQTVVWEQARANTQRLSGALNDPVASPASPSSFQLAMESPKLNESAEPYVAKLGPSIDGKDDVIGYALAINGKLTGADVYGSHALFVKLWPKLLKSGAVEAIAERKSNDKLGPTVSADDVRKFLDNAAKAQAERKQINERTAATTYDGSDSVLIETADDADGVTTTVRQTYIGKQGPKDK